MYIYHIFPNMHKNSTGVTSPLNVLLLFVEMNVLFVELIADLSWSSMG